MEPVTDTLFLLQSTLLPCFLHPAGVLPLLVPEVCSSADSNAVFEAEGIRNCFADYLGCTRDELTASCHC